MPIGRRISVTKSSSWSMGHVAVADWFPMETFERFGIAILSCVGEWSYSVPYDWGRVSANQLGDMYEGLIVVGDPSATLLRIHGLRAMFFNFDPVFVRSATDAEAIIDINYEMRDVAEAAACYQARGFFEEMVRISGGSVRSAMFIERRWEGFERSVLKLTWATGELVSLGTK